MINSIEQLSNLVNINNENSDVHFYLWSKDKNGKYLSCNKIMYRDVGFSNESDMLGLTDLDLCWEKSGILFRTNDQIIMHERKPKFFIEPSKILSGKEINFYSYKTPLLGRTKKVLGTMGFSFPLTEQNNRSQKDTLLSTLSPREKQCLAYYLKGKTAKETAHLLKLSYRTIEDYFTSIKKKLCCRNKRDLISLFIYK